jgi:hypothetical protein
MNQFVSLEHWGGKPYVSSRTTENFISTTRDFLDLVAWCGENGTSLCLMWDTNLPPEFYDLKSGIAGEMLQKVSNYHMRLAIVGSFALATSARFREFMAESNKGSQVYFAADNDEALAWLMK